MGGDEGLAARRVNKAMGLLKGSDGVWRKFVCVTPSGEQAEVYISRDKNRRQILTEQISKKLKTVLEEKVDNGKTSLHLLRSEGMVTYKWQPLARVSPYADGSFQVHWNPSTLRKLPELSKNDVLEELENLHGTKADGIEWCL